MSVSICNYVFIGFKMELGTIRDRINKIYDDEELEKLLESYQNTSGRLFIDIDDNYIIGGYCLNYSHDTENSVVLNLDFISHFQIEHYLTDSFWDDITILLGHNISEENIDLGIIVHTQYN